MKIPKKFLKAAVIGLGVGERHVESYESDPRCTVVALCDINEEKLLEVGGKYPGRRLTKNAEEIFDDPDIDIVSIASYDNYHCSHVLLAIEAGKHIFVEKPLCLHDYEFDKIDEALVKHPYIKLSSNLVLRRAPQFLKVKEQIKAESLGRLYYFEGDYNYGRIHKITEGWRGQIPFYSVTHGGAIHLIDLILWLSGGRIIEVIATGSNITTENSQFQHPDMITAIMKFEDGITAKVTANFGCVCPHHHTISVFGTKGSFIHNYQGGVFYHSRDPKDPVEKIQMTYQKEAKGDVQRDFVAHILDGNPSEVSITDVMNVMAVSLAVERSLHSKKWETVRYARCTTDNKFQN